QESTSDLLRDNCDEFIYYEDLSRPGITTELTPEISSHLPEQKRKGFSLLLESLLALRRENKEVLWSSMIKDTMKRKKPSFNEAYHGYRTFSELLEDAQKEGILDLEIDKRSRTYVVTRFGSEPKSEALPAARKKKRRRSKRKVGHPGESAAAVEPAREVVNGASRIAEEVPRPDRDRDEPLPSAPRETPHAAEEPAAEAAQPRKSRPRERSAEELPPEDSEILFSHPPKQELGDVPPE